MAETSTPTAPTTDPAPPPADPSSIERAPTEFMGDIEADFKDMDAGKTPAPRPGKVAKPKPTAKPKAAAKPDDEPPASEEPVVPDTPPEKPADEPPAEDVTAPQVKPVKAADLRTSYESLKKKVKEEYEPQLQSLKAKVKDLETRAPQDAAPILAKVKELETRNAELEKAIEYVDFSQSDIYNKEYAEPYRQAWEEAVSEFRELTVRERDGTDEDTGEARFKTRPADENDLLKLANLRLSEMDAEATEMFGPSAARAINHIQNIKKLSAKQSHALAEAKNRAAERKVQRELEQKQQSRVLGETWAETNKALEEKYPKAFKPIEGDAEDAEAHAKGFALANLMFLGNAALTPEQIAALPSSFRKTLEDGQPLSAQQKVQLHSLARLKMANHDRKVAQLKKATARIAELEEAIAQYEKSTPEGGKAGAASGVESGKDWMQTAEEELRALDKS